MKKVDVFVIYPLRYHKEIKTHLKDVHRDHKQFRLITFNNREKWKEEAKKEIEGAKLIIVFIPPEGLTENMEFEQKIAEDKKRAIIEIYYDEWENCSEKIHSELNKQLERAAIINLGIGKNDYTADYKSTLLDQYEMLVNSSENLESRRQVAADRFSTISCAVLAIIGSLFVFGGMDSAIAMVAVILLSCLGMFISWNWKGLVESFGKINESKYRLIHIIERELSVNTSNAEWEDLINPISVQYISYTKSERRTPLIIGAMFFSIMGIGLILFALAL